MKRSMKLSFVVLTVMCVMFMCNVAFAEITPENVAVNSYINVDMDKDGTHASYKIEVPSTGTLVVYGDLSKSFGTYIELYNNDNQLLISDSGNWVDNNILNMKNISMPIQLTAGTYYLSVSNGSYSEKLEGKLFIKFTPSKTANYNSTLKGQLYRNETITYQVKVPYNGYFYLKGSFVASHRQNIEILDADGQIIDNDGSEDWFNNGASGLMDLKFKTKSFKAGTYYVKIKNKNYGNLSYNISLKTYVPATALKLNKYSIALKKGASYQLKAVMGPTNTTDKLNWSSSNSKVAVVTSTGKVVAKGKGVAYIKVKTSSGLFKKVKVVVK